MAQTIKNLPANARDASRFEPWIWKILPLGFVLAGSGRSPGEGSGNPLQYSCLGNPMDRGAWWAIVYGVARVGHDLKAEHVHMGKII